METKNIDRALDWEDEIENDGKEFVLLPGGTYTFTVRSFERGRYEGGKKMPPCNKAIVYLEIDSDLGSVTIKENFMLHTRMEWKLCEFFTSIGLRKKGEKLHMRWNEIIGLKGRCEVYIDEFQGRDGNMVQINRIKNFYEPLPNHNTTSAAATNSTTNSTPAYKSYTQGSF